MNSWVLLIQQNLSQPWAGILALSPAPGLCKELFNNIHGAIWPQIWDANAICSLKIAQWLRGVVQHLLLLGKGGSSERRKQGKSSPGWGGAGGALESQLLPLPSP